MGLGSLIVGGIQDVSAFLPLLGTDQCEAHIGVALDRGFLYAAAAPLSIFGCLGIVKAAFGILIASIDVPLFNGARIMRDAGFELAGPVAAMISMKKAHGQCVAASRFADLIVKENLSNPHEVSITCRYSEWNVRLVSTTLVLSLLSLTPYISIMVTQDGARVTWLYPSVRVAGSILCAIVSQFLLQDRIGQLLTKARQGAMSFSAETEVPELYRHLIPVWAYHLLLVTGCVATGIGYVGCFAVVQSGSLNDTLIWLGLEALLSLLRIFLWAWNPDFVEETYFVISKRDRDGCLPINTTGLVFETDLVLRHQAFTISHRISQYGLQVSSPPGFQEHKSWVIFHATARSYNARGFSLLVTVVNTSTEDTFVLVRNSDPSKPIAAYSALVGMRSGFIQVRLVEEIDHSFILSDEYQDVYSQCAVLMALLRGPDMGIDELRVSWTGEIILSWASGARENGTLVFVEEEAYSEEARLRVAPSRMAWVANMFRGGEGEE